MRQSYSVLMSVYYREKPEYLEQSMRSIYNQTIPTDDFVLVCDGALTKDLDAVIAKMQGLFQERLQVVRLKRNSGLGKALNIGLQHCQHELVARMDSDDISRINRCEKELAIFEQMPQVSIVSGFVEEFDGDIAHVQSQRIVPEQQNSILHFAKKRNPFNHPCVMYRKSAVEAVGSYQDFYLLEDYHLWLRMLKAGFQGYNLQEPLLWMRAGKGMYKRRGGWKYVKAQRQLLKFMRREKMISAGEYAFVLLGRMGVAMMPNKLRSLIFEAVLRKPNRNSGGGTEC